MFVKTRKFELLF